MSRGDRGAAALDQSPQPTSVRTRRGSRRGGCCVCWPVLDGTVRRALGAGDVALGGQYSAALREVVSGQEAYLSYRAFGDRPA